MIFGARCSITILMVRSIEMKIIVILGEPTTKSIDRSFIICHIENVSCQFQFNMNIIACNVVSMNYITTMNEWAK